MCRPAATSPIPRSTRNSRTSSPSSTRCARMRRLRPAEGRARDPGRRSQCRAARARRLEPQAAAEGRLAHAGRDARSSPRAEGRRLDRRAAPFVRRSRRSSTRGGAIARWTLGGRRQGPPARSYLGRRRHSPTACRHRHREDTRLGAPVRPRAGDGDPWRSEASGLRSALFPRRVSSPRALSTWYSARPCSRAICPRQPDSPRASSGKGCAISGRPPSALSR